MVKGRYPCPKCGKNDWNPVLWVEGEPYDECKNCGYHFTSTDIPWGKEKCKCGHQKGSHRSIVGLIGAGLRSYRGCRFCACQQFEDPEPKRLSV